MTKWSRRKARPRQSVPEVWIGVTPSTKRRRLARARSLAAGVIAAIVVIAIWATTAEPRVRSFESVADRLETIEVLATRVTTSAWAVALWPFVLVTAAWYLVVERRRLDRGPGRTGLRGDGWLALAAYQATAVASQAAWPFPVTGVLDETAGTLTTHPVTAGANAIVGITVVSVLIALGMALVIRLAEQRDAEAIEAARGQAAGSHVARQRRASAT